MRVGWEGLVRERERGREGEILLMLPPLSYSAAAAAKE